MTDSRTPPLPQQSDDEGAENSRNVLRTMSGAAPIAASSIDFDPQTGLVRVDHGEGTVTLDTDGAEVTVDPQTGEVTVEAPESEEPAEPEPVAGDDPSETFRPYANKQVVKQSGQQGGADPVGGGGGSDWGTEPGEPLSHGVERQQEAALPQSGGLDTAAVFARVLHPAREPLPQQETTADSERLETLAPMEPRTAVAEPLTAPSPATVGPGNPTVLTANSSSEVTEGEDPSSGPRVEIDPDSGLVTIEHADGTVSLDPGDADVRIDQETGEVTISPEAPEASEEVPGDAGPAPLETVGPVPSGQVVVDAKTGLITIGYEGGQLTLDPTTGETVLDPGDSPVSLDPDTGLLTVGDPEEVDGPEAPGEVSSDTGGGPEEETLLESGDALVTVDPETGLLTVDHADGRITIDPEDGGISVELGDGQVSVDPETGEVTVAPAEDRTDGGAPPSSAPSEADGDASPTTQQAGGTGDSTGTGTGEPPSTVQDASFPPSPPTTTADSTGTAPAPGTPPPAPHTDGVGDEHGRSRGGGPPGTADGTDSGGELPPLSRTQLLNPLEESTSEDSRDTDSADTGEADPSASPKYVLDDPPEEETEDEEDDGDDGTDSADDEDEDGEQESGGGQEDDEGDGEDGEDAEKAPEEEPEEEDDEEDEGEGRDEKDGDGGDSGSGGNGGRSEGEGGSDAAKIDFAKVKEFNDTFVTNIQTRVHRALEEMSAYEDAGKDHILVGNGALLEPAADLTSKVNNRLSEIYGILVAIESEMVTISDNLTETAVEFLMLEEDQQLDSQRLAMILGSGGSTNSSGPGYGGGPGGGSSGGSNDESDSEPEDESGD